MSGVHLPPRYVVMTYIVMAYVVMANTFTAYLLAAAVPIDVGLSLLTEHSYGLYNYRQHGLLVMVDIVMSSCSAGLCSYRLYSYGLYNNCQS